MSKIGKNLSGFIFVSQPFEKLCVDKFLRSDDSKRFRDINFHEKDENL